MLLKNIILKIVHLFVRLYYPIIYQELHKYKVLSIKDTIKSLIHSNKSISRFGDGEIKWVLRCNSGSFENNSKLLSDRLIDVLSSNNDRLEIGLPERFRSCLPFTYKSNRYWKLLLVKYIPKFLNFLDTSKTYYNADITRPYIYYKHKYRCRNMFVFTLLKEIWNKKNILIVEGKDTKLGLGNDLFSNVENIKRIECPSENAFESYDNILLCVIKFLKQNSNKNYLPLIALGPTATVLVYDLLKLGYRSLDIGHVDFEYNYYLSNNHNLFLHKNHKIHFEEYSDQIIRYVR